ncbi:hypothetical protein L7F22_053036 [Adiantum nelumboides]|nr:hypothetical protein [Adiantum nelumboides]
MEVAWIVGLCVVAMAAWRFSCAEMRRRRLVLLQAADDPHSVTASLFTLEFPFLLSRAMELGLLRTFAIPSISRTLRKGNQYTLNASKRFDDTEILIVEMMVHHVDSPRGSLALRRLNFLHSPYAISNEDYLYVLCLIFTVLPQWAARYGYRAWTDFEISCNYKVWHDIGVRMGIRDIPPSFDAAVKYVDEYEAKHMVYADSNREITEPNLKVFLSKLPMCLQPIVRKLMYAFMDDRLREALGYPKQPTWLSYLLHSILKMQGVLIGWMPPRPVAKAQMRIPYFGCPVLKSLDEARATTFPLAFQRYKPYAYEKGYKIAELGGMKHGKLSDPFEGALLCPFRDNHAANFLKA